MYIKGFQLDNTGLWCSDACLNYLAMQPHCCFDWVVPHSCYPRGRLGIVSKWILQQYINRRLKILDQNSVTKYGNPYQGIQNWLQIRWRKSGITWIWAMLSLLRVLRHLLLNGIGRIQKFDSLYDVIFLVFYYFTFS